MSNSRMIRKNIKQATNRKMQVMTSTGRLTILTLLVTALFSLLLFPSFAVAQSQQKTFVSAKAAAAELFAIVEGSTSTTVEELLGTEYLYLLPLDELDEEDRMLFIYAWRNSHKLVAGKNKATLIELGARQWTFPIPLLKNSQGWYFDTQAGAEVVKTRSIGRNELSTMQAALAYYDAQNEYAEQDRNGDGILEYAQQFISTADKQDGLYWNVKTGEPLSPLGSLFTTDKAQGAYHGYHYKILTAQGSHARGGSRNYLVAGQMRFGFALLAWPAEYDESGVMSFQVNHDGTLYEKDLGSNTDDIAAEISSYDPGEGWKPVAK